MASLSFVHKPRPCVYKDARGQIIGNALFHCWFPVSEIVAPSLLNGGHPGGVVSGVLGLIEGEDGCMQRVTPERIQFLDNIFQEYNFTPRNKKGE